MLYYKISNSDKDTSNFDKIYDFFLMENIYMNLEDDKNHIDENAEYIDNKSITKTIYRVECPPTGTDGRHTEKHSKSRFKVSTSNGIESDFVFDPQTGDIDFDNSIIEFKGNERRNIIGIMTAFGHYCKDFFMDSELGHISGKARSDAFSDKMYEFNKLDKKTFKIYYRGEV